ncbi:CCKAR-like protein, partial [Mya arenaria]
REQSVNFALVRTTDPIGQLWGRSIKRIALLPSSTLLLSSVKGNIGSARWFRSYVTFNSFKINDQEVKALYPLIFFYAIILMIGVIGNAVVLLVYTYQYKRSPARMFILFLASIDFSICLFGLPYHMIDLTHPYTFTNAISCKILTFIISLFFHMSIFGLIVIAVDRYLKICRPLSSFQMSYFGKRRACALASIAAVMFAWPNIVLYGPSEMETFYQNVSGHACFFTTEYTETIYPLFFTMNA